VNLLLNYHTMKTTKVLLIEDDLNYAFMIKDGLEEMNNGYEVEMALNAEDGLKLFKSFEPDVIVTDIVMPGMSGLQMVEKIRQDNKELPVIFTTGLTADKDAVNGINKGADIYITKPFSIKLLNTYIISLLKRLNNGKSWVMKDLLKIGRYTFNPQNRVLIYEDSDKMVLTTTEAKIFEKLLRRKGELVERNDILVDVWGEDCDIFSYSISLNVFITKLRKYLAKDASISITNYRLIGYMLDVG